MKIKQKIGSGLKSLIDFRRWMGWEHIKSSASGIRGLAKTVFSPQEIKRKETFEEAITRLNLTEEMIKKQMRRHLQMSAIYGSITLILFAYSVYLLTSGKYQGFLLGLFVSILASSFTFREHFYYFQIKKRKLGCSLNEWVNFILGRASK